MMMPIVLSLEECKTVLTGREIPCRVTTTWVYPSNCTNYTANLYNNTGSSIHTYTLGDFGIYCNFTFNYTELGSYYYNISSGDSGSITVEVEEETMTLFGVILAPLILGFFFLIGAATLGEEHAPLKIFLFLLSIPTFFVSLHFGTLAIIEYYTFTALQNAIGTTVYWIAWVFAVIVTYFIIYLISKLIERAAQNKKERLQY